MKQKYGLTDEELTQELLYHYVTNQRQHEEIEEQKKYIEHLEMLLKENGILDFDFDW